MNHCTGQNAQFPTEQDKASGGVALSPSQTYFSPPGSFLSLKCSKLFLAAEPSEGAISPRTLFPKTLTWLTPSHTSGVSPHVTFSESPLACSLAL